ncbi:MAG: LPS export ABC transporter periplasmic protein LptC [Candidatus Omnitrophota bacterium]
MKDTILMLICAICLALNAGCSRSAEETLPEKQPEQAADETGGDGEEMLSNFSVSGYTQGGQRQWDMAGKSANIMDEEIALKNVTGKVYGDQANMTVVADRGTLNRVDSNVHLEKNVLATSEDGASLSTDSLDWDAQNQKLTTEAPVCIKKGGMEAFGTGIVAQPVLNLVELNKDVTVNINLDAKNTAGDGSSPEQDALPALPTVITCTGSLKVDYQNNVAFFQDNVQAKDTRGQIFADEMDVYFTSASKDGEKATGMQDLGIEKIVALGSVEIHHGSNITYSEKAVYDASSGKLTLTGRPKLVIYSTEDFGQLIGGK